MAERLHPGVYVEEVNGGVRPIEGVSTSTAAFVGESARGIPGLAQLTTSFPDYSRAFGGHQPGEEGLLAQAVEAFFNSGGKRAYVVRVLPSDADRGVSSTIATRQPGVDALVFKARGAGAWSSSLRINLLDSANFPLDAFSVEVLWTEAGATRVLETFADVRMDPTSEDYVGLRINDISKYIQVVDKLAAAVDALDPGEVLLPAQPPILRSKAIDAGTVALYDGTRLLITSTDTSSTDGPQALTIAISPASIAAAIPAGTPTFTNGKVLLTAAQLAAVIQKAIDLEAGSPLTAAVVSGAVQVSVDVADPPVLKIAAPGGGGTYDLSGQTVVVAVDGVNTTVGLSAVANANAVTPDELRAALATSLGGKVVSALKNADSSLTLTGHAKETGGGTLALSVTPNATALTGTATAGTAGIPPDRFDGLLLSIAEVISPTVTPVLRGLGFPGRVRGYRDNSGANPLARPVVSSSLKLAGGTDGAAALTTTDFVGDSKLRTGLHALDGIDVNLVTLPGKNEPAYISAGIGYCDGRGDCFFIADGPGAVDFDFSVGPDDARQFVEGLPARSENAAIFYPWVRVPDPVGVGRNPTRLVAPSGHVAGIFARTDVTRGVWKAPAGIEAQVTDALGLQYPVIDQEQDVLNPISLNCLRQFPGVGIVSWGSRTLSADPQWRYVPVRRMALFLKESIRRGLLWAVFEPNDQELWGRIRLNVNAFMMSLFRQGAFQGATAEEAFQVLCDRSTNPQELVDQGIVTAQVAFAPLKPAEFVVVQISQKSLLVA